MQAIILAAGMGKRLGTLTRENTKCMVEVGGIKLIERALKILDKEHLSRIIIVVGYKHENLMAFVDGLGINTEIKYIVNDVYDKTKKESRSFSGICSFHPGPGGLPLLLPGRFPGA